MLKKSFAVSGYNGFIGSHVTGILSSQGHSVHPIPHKFLLMPAVLNEYASYIKPDYIIHLAAYGNHHSESNETWTYESNVLGLINLLNSTVGLPYEGFINVSSSSVYGTKKDPMKETDTLDTDSFYGASKVAGEYICKAHAIQNNKPIVTVRPFSVYGPNENSPEHLIPSVLRSLKTGEEINLVPNAMHDWIDVESFIQGLLAVLDHADRLKGQSINIGSGFQYSNKQVVEFLEDISGKKANYKIKGSLRSNDVNSWVSDNTLLKRLGWNPKYSLREGLVKVWEAA